MKENIDPMAGNKNAYKNGDFSIFRENYQRDQKIIAGLEQQIVKRKKFIEKEKNPETVTKIKKEIMKLENEKQKMQYYAEIELHNHGWSTELLEDFNPEEKAGKA